MGDFLNKFRKNSHTDSEVQTSKICEKCKARQAHGTICRRCGGKLLEPEVANDHYLGLIIGGKYKLVERLGAGGMGVVYRGVNEELGQNVAVKFLHEKFAQDKDVISRFITEAKSYARVSHPNAVTLLEYGQHEKSLYIITEFIDGESLTDVLKSNGPLSVVDCLHVALQICEVLSVAHAQGVIHRDLKPDNIMLSRNSRGRYVAKVLDFGIAKIADDEQGPVTQTGLVFGTPEFMSPEQARGWDAEPRSDLYALGIIMYYSVTGKLPFRDKSKLGILNKQIHEKPVQLSKVRTGMTFSQPFEFVVEKLLEKDPQNRYCSADALAEVLEQVLSYEMGDTFGHSERLVESTPNYRIYSSKSGIRGGTRQFAGGSLRSTNLTQEDRNGTINLRESDIVETRNTIEEQETVPSEPDSLSNYVEKKTPPRPPKSSTAKRKSFDPGAIEISRPGSKNKEVEERSVELWREYPYNSFTAKRKKKNRRLYLGIITLLLAISGASGAFWLTSNRSNGVVKLNHDAIAELSNKAETYLSEKPEVSTDSNLNKPGKDATSNHGSADANPSRIENPAPSESTKPTQKVAPTVAHPPTVAQAEPHPEPTIEFEKQLTTIARIFENGDIVGAQKNLNAFTNQNSATWNQAEKMSVKELSMKLSDARTWRIQASEALEAKDCDRAAELNDKILLVSKGVSIPIAKAIENCRHVEKPKQNQQLAIADKPKQAALLPKKGAAPSPQPAAKPEPKPVTKVASRVDKKPIAVAKHVVATPTAAKPAPKPVTKVASRVDKKPIAVAKHVVATPTAVKPAPKPAVVVKSEPKHTSAPEKAMPPRTIKPILRDDTVTEQGSNSQPRSGAVPKPRNSKHGSTLPAIDVIAKPAGVPDDFMRPFDESAPPVEEKEIEGKTPESRPAYVPPSKEERRETAERSLQSVASTRPVVSQMNFILPVKELPSRGKRSHRRRRK